MSVIVIHVMLKFILVGSVRCIGGWVSMHMLLFVQYAQGHQQRWTAKNVMEEYFANRVSKYFTTRVERKSICGPP
jgi:hypothetical protein